MQFSQLAYDATEALPLHLTDDYLYVNILKCEMVELWLW